MLKSAKKEEEMVLVKEPTEFIRGKYKLKAFELKLLSYLFGKIDPEHDKPFKKYTITVKEIQEVFNKNYGEIYESVKKAFRSLIDIKIELEYKDTWCIFTIVIDPTIFKRSGTIGFYISPKLLDLLKTSKHYLKYDISVLAYFNSAYSVRLYKILKDRYEIATKFGKAPEWSITIEEFKNLLGVPVGYTFGKIKEKVLNKALKEINAYSDIKINIEEIKKGRKVENLKFYIQSNNNLIKAEEKKSSSTPSLPPVQNNQHNNIKQFRQEILTQFDNKDKYFLIDDKEFSIKDNLLYVNNKCVSASEGIKWWNYIYKHKDKITVIDPVQAQKEALKQLDTELKKTYIGKETIININGEYTPVTIININLKEDFENTEVIFRAQDNKTYKATYSLQTLKNLIS